MAADSLSAGCGGPKRTVAVIGENDEKSASGVLEKPNLEIRKNNVRDVVRDDPLPSRGRE